MPIYRAVLDTNVVLAALWSRTGASSQLFVELRAGRWALLLSNHLILEYEEVAKRNSVDIGLTLAEIDGFLDAICVSAETHQLKPGWPTATDRP
jgi:predicted nucleic acid-binding protein